MLESVRSDLDRIARGLQASRPDTNADLSLFADSIRRDFIRDDDQVLLALGAAVFFLVLFSVHPSRTDLPARALLC